MHYLLGQANVLREEGDDVWSPRRVGRRGPGKVGEGAVGERGGPGGEEERGERGGMGRGGGGRGRGQERGCFFVCVDVSVFRCVLMCVVKESDHARRVQALVRICASARLFVSA